MKRKENHLYDTLIIEEFEFDMLCFGGMNTDDMMSIFETCPIYCDDKPIGVVRDIEYGDEDNFKCVRVLIFKEFITKYLECNKFEFVMSNTGFDFLRAIWKCFE